MSATEVIFTATLTGEWAGHPQIVLGTIKALKYWKSSEISAFEKL